MLCKNFRIALFSLSLCISLCFLFGSGFISVRSENFSSTSLMTNVLAWLSAIIFAGAKADGSVVGTLVCIFLVVVGR